MPSISYRRWTTVRAAVLNDVEAAHAAVGGTGRGRRLAFPQVNRAYAILLSAEFQGFCKELHRECAEYIVSLAPVAVQDVLLQQFLAHRLLDRGNPNPGNLGADFGRLGFHFWKVLDTAESRAPDWRHGLESLNNWRNAIAHHDYNTTRLGGTILRVRQVREWRTVCRRLARLFDAELARQLDTLTGRKPW